MPRNIYARTASRGFPVFDASGQSGQGHLPDSTLPGSSSPGYPSATWTDPNVDQASVGAVQAPPSEFIAGGLWGLSGSLNPDRTPRSHAAPIADPTLPVGDYFGEADATHAFSEGGPEERHNIPSVAGFRLDHVTAQGGSGSNLQPLTGQIRGMADFDAVQGYGGGADGPGGVNGSMPLTVDQRNYPGETYHNVTVNAAEVPFLVAETAQFIPNDASMFPWSSGLYDAPTAAVRAQDVTATDVPAQGSPVGSGGVPAYVQSFWS